MHSCHRRKTLVTQPRSHPETQQEAEAPLQPKLLRADTSDLLLDRENHSEIRLKFDSVVN